MNTRRRMISSSADGLRMLAMPPPFRAWLTISNDPDFTTVEAWRQLDQKIWKELELPLADSFFITSHNENLPNQVNLQSHPEILQSHPHDTMHTWGDYLQSRSVRFSRDSAHVALARLQELNQSPRVWTDHSGFEGNLIHRATHATTRYTQDTAGHKYENFTYTLDLIKQAGVRYVWDGEARKLIGQDRHLGRLEHYQAATNSQIKASVRTVADWAFARAFRKLGLKPFSYQPGQNRQYERHEFPDSQVFYKFRRYGLWKNADIDGLAASLSAANIDNLLKVGGTSVVYTHLGKPKVERLNDPQHIPQATARALASLAKLYGNKDLMISGTADLLDYLVLRDHAILSRNLDFRPDGIRFTQLSEADLVPYSFGVYSTCDDFRVLCNGNPTSAIVEPLGKGFFRAAFTGGEPKSPTKLAL